MIKFKIRYTPDNLLKCQLSYALKSVEVEDKFIVCELIDIQSSFVKKNQLKLSYIKKDILNIRI